MTVAVGPVLLILSSFLLGAVLVLAAFGIVLWIGFHHRRAKDKTTTRAWGHAPQVIANRDSAFFVVPRK